MYIFKEFLSQRVLEELIYEQNPHLGRNKSRNIKTSISHDINLTYVCTKGYISKYANITQYDRRILHLHGLITWETNYKRCKCVCKSQNVCPLM